MYGVMLSFLMIMQRIEALLGETGEESLWDDVLLCRVVNKLHPGLITTIHQPEGGEVQTQTCIYLYRNWMQLTLHW